MAFCASKHEAGIAYQQHFDKEEWNTSPQHRSPPFVNFYAGDTEYLAILDTGALDISFDTPTAKFVGLESFPSVPKLYDWG